MQLEKGGGFKINIKEETLRRDLPFLNTFPHNPLSLWLVIQRETSLMVPAGLRDTYALEGTPYQEMRRLPSF